MPYCSEIISLAKCKYEGGWGFLFFFSGGYVTSEKLGLCFMKKRENSCYSRSVSCS